MSRNKPFIRKKQARQILLYATVITMIVILCFPVYWMIVQSIGKQGVTYSNPPIFFPQSLNFQAYQNLIASRPILNWVINSTIVVIGSTGLALLLAIPAGYALSRLHTRTAESAAFFLLVTRMFPSTMLVLPLFILFGKMGMLDNHNSLMIAYSTFSIPFAVWMMKGFFDSIPIDLEEAAMVDGCNEIQALTKIIIPLTLPGIAATTVYCTILGWGEFLYARTFISKDSMQLMTVGNALLRSEYLMDWDQILAGAVISTIPVLIVFMLLERFLVQGLTAGAVKG